MILLVGLLVLSVVALVASLRSILHDGPACPPRSHRVDTDFVPPSARSSFHHAA